MLLVVDARAQAAIAAAVVRGFATHRPDVGIAGVVFNRVGSERHAAVLREACALTRAGDPGARLPAARRRPGAAGTPSRPGPGGGASRSRRLPRSRRRLDRRARRDRAAAALARPAMGDAARRRGRGRAGAAARPAHRRRRRCRLRLPLSAGDRRLARGGRRDPAVLAARRRGARRAAPTPSICRAAIPNCTPAGSPATRASSPGCAQPRRAAPPSSASAAATW